MADCGGCADRDNGLERLRRQKAELRQQLDECRNKTIDECYLVIRELSTGKAFTEAARYALDGLKSPDQPTPEREDAAEADANAT